MAMTVTAIVMQSTEDDSAGAGDDVKMMVAVILHQTGD